MDKEQRDIINKKRLERRRKKRENTKTNKRKRFYRALAMPLTLFILLTVFFTSLFISRPYVSKENTKEFSGTVLSVYKQDTKNKNIGSVKLLINLDNGKQYELNIESITDSGYTFDSFKDTIEGREVTLRIKPHSNRRVAYIESGGNIIIGYDVINRAIKSNRIAIPIVYVLAVLSFGVYCFCDLKLKKII